jgi:DNA-binding CsgD family transcriptional regulator
LSRITSSHSKGLSESGQSQSLFELYESVALGKNKVLASLKHLLTSLRVDLYERPLHWRPDFFDQTKALDIRHADLPVQAHTFQDEQTIYLGIPLDSHCQLIFESQYGSEHACQHSLSELSSKGLLEHVIQALQMVYHLEQQQHELESIHYVLDHYPLPVAAVDNHLNAIFTNMAFTNAIENLNQQAPSDTLKTLKQQSRETINLLALSSNAEQNTLLKDALRTCTQANTANFRHCQLDIKGRQQSLIVVSAHSVPNLFHHYARDGLAWVYLLDTSYRNILQNSAPFIALKLSSAEKALCLLLFEGHNLSTIAEHRRVSQQTVRKQLQSVLRKTQQEGQENLILFLFKTCIQHGLTTNIV